MAGDFDESSHPRAADGKFGQGSGGGKQKASPSQDQKAKDQKAKPTARSKAAAAKAKVGERRKAAKAKAKAVVAKAKLRAKAMVEKARALKPRGKVPTKEAKAKVSAARTAAKAKAKEVVAKAKERAAQIKAKAGVQPAKTKAVGPAGKPTDGKPTTAIAAATPASAAEFRQHQASFEKHATSDERQAALVYSGHQYSEINASLRGVAHDGPQTIKPDRISKVVEHLDSALAKVRIQNPVITYRGSSGRPDVMAMKPGDVIHDKAYVSTSTDKRIAEEFAANADNGVVFHITSPVGTNIGAIPSQFSTEKEMLLGRGVAMRLDRHEIVTHDDGVQVHVMHMTVVGQA